MLVLVLCHSSCWTAPDNCCCLAIFYNSLPWTIPEFIFGVPDGSSCDWSPPCQSCHSSIAVLQAYLVVWLVALVGWKLHAFLVLEMVTWLRWYIPLYIAIENQWRVLTLFITLNHLVKYSSKNAFIILRVTDLQIRVVNASLCTQ